MGHKKDNEHVQESVTSYSSFFRTLHDEHYTDRSITPNCRFFGSHTSVLQALVFNDELGNPCEGHEYNVAVIWDPDHDERIIRVLDACYRRRILSSFIALGEREGILTAVLNPIVSDPHHYRRAVFVDGQLTEIGAKEVDYEYWCVEVRGMGCLGGKDTLAYLNKLRTVWRLGLAGSLEYADAA